MRRIAVAGLVIVTLCFGIVSQSLAVEYGGIGGTPANPDSNNPRTKSIFVYTAEPGEIKKDGIRIANNSDKTRTIEVYATDSEVASGGSFACKQKVDPKKQVGSWIKFDKSEVTLAPATNEVINFQLQAPEKVDVGEHNGCVVVQEKLPQTAAQGNGVQISLRSALRVAVTIPGAITKDLQLSSLKSKADANKHIFSVGIHNNGNVSLDTDIKVSVYNIFGRQTYSNGGVYPVLAQSQDYELNYEMEHSFWGGFYRVSASAEYDSDPKVGLGQTGNAKTKRNSPTKTIFITPKPGAIVLYLFVIAGIGLAIKYVLYMRKKKQHIGETWSDYTVKKSDTVHKLAEIHHTNWKEIVRVNKLKAPYALEPKSTIKLPPKPHKVQSVKAASTKKTINKTTKTSVKSKDTNNDEPSS